MHPYMAVELQPQASDIDFKKTVSRKQPAVGVHKSTAHPATHSYVSTAFMSIHYNLYCT